MTRPLGLRERKGHRLASQVYAATEYEFHFTVCARHQGEPFRNARLAETVIDSLLWTKDHLGRFKSYTTNQSWKMGISGKLWQKSSYDRVLDMERPFLDVVEYALDNPVRKGLVKDWREWPFSRIVDPWW